MEKFTAGYDSVIVVNAKMLNDVAIALFYSNYLTFNKEIDFTEGQNKLPDSFLEAVPKNLNSFLKVRLRSKLLHEPFFQFIKSKDANGRDVNQMTMSVHLRLYIWMMDGLELKFDADVALKGSFNFICRDNVQLLSVPLNANCITQFDVTIADSRSSLVLKDIQSIFRPVLNEYFNTVDPIEIKMPSFGLYFPHTGPHTAANRFDVKVAEVKVIGYQLLAIAVNFMNNKGGNPGALCAFAPNSTFSLAVSERALMQAFDFYCTHFTPKTFYFEGRKDHWSADAIGWIGVQVKSFLTNLATNFKSLGFRECHCYFKDACYFGSVRLSIQEKPEIEFKPGNIISVKKLAIGLWVSAGIEVEYEKVYETDPTGWLPDCVPDKVTKRERHRELWGISEFPLARPEIEDVSAEFHLDETTNALAMKIRKIKFKHILFRKNDFAHGMTDAILRSLTNWIADLVVEKLPVFYLTPEIHMISVPRLNLPMVIERSKLTFGDGAVRASVTLGCNRLEKITEPMPKYIGNTNNMEVHRIGCPCILDTYETHQKGYYSLQQAIRAGYDGCKNCLPAYHRR
ncbi:MAG: hypothetical protein IIT53_10825 [Fibrobacter sp.]|nr:hypothetical protein [Fibrobacter sp.]